MKVLPRYFSGLTYVQQTFQERPGVLALQKGDVLAEAEPDRLVPQSLDSFGENSVTGGQSLCVSSSVRWRGVDSA